MLNKYGLIKTDEAKVRFLAAVSRLKVNEDFQQFTAILEEVQNVIDQRNRFATSPNLEWGQGEAQLIDQILKLIGGAEKERDAIKKQVEQVTPRTL